MIAHCHWFLPVHVKMKIYYALFNSHLYMCTSCCIRSTTPSVLCVSVFGVPAEYFNCRSCQMGFRVLSNCHLTAFCPENRPVVILKNEAFIRVSNYLEIQMSNRIIWLVTIRFEFKI